MRSTPLPTSDQPPAGVPAVPPLPPDLEALQRRMRFPRIRAQAPDILATARSQRRDCAEVIKALLVEEVTGRTLCPANPPHRRQVPHREDLTSRPALRIGLCGLSQVRGLGTL